LLGKVKNIGIGIGIAFVIFIVIVGIIDYQDSTAEFAQIIDAKIVENNDMAIAIQFTDEDANDVKLNGVINVRIKVDNEEKLHIEKELIFSTSDFRSVRNAFGIKNTFLVLEFPIPDPERKTYHLDVDVETSNSRWTNLEYTFKN